LKKMRDLTLQLIPESELLTLDSEYYHNHLVA
jgi:hypothetical protein